jgi:sterol desaturase/sphingolipid hydroxylase (fatty acid hydroxylase superfamily)
MEGTQLLLGNTGFNFIKLLVISGGAFLAITQIKKLAQKKVYSVKFGKNQIRKELEASASVIFFDSFVFVVLYHTGILPALKYEGILPIIITYISLFIWFEIWFYLTHRLMHTKALYWIHEQHHIAKVTSPFSAMSFSLLERLILVIGANIIPMLLAPKLFGFEVNLIGNMLYFFTNYMLNVWGHLNIELIPHRWVKKLFPFILNTTTYHSLHHARYNGHYGLFTPFLDLWFNSYFKDYPKIHRLTSEGHPMTKLSFRLDEDEYEYDKTEFYSPDKSA